MKHTWTVLSTLSYTKIQDYLHPHCIRLCFYTASVTADITNCGKHLKYLFLCLVFVCWLRFGATKRQFAGGAQTSSISSRGREQSGRHYSNHCLNIGQILIHKPAYTRNTIEHTKKIQNTFSM